MTDRAQPGGDDTAGINYEFADVVHYASMTDGWVVPGSDSSLAQYDSNVDETVLAAFGQSSSASSFDVTIDPGQAFVEGWFARDTSTTVTLASSTANQTVYAGWDAEPGTSGTDVVIIGTASDFTNRDPKLPLWTFDTDGSGVTSVVDERQVGHTTNFTEWQVDTEPSQDTDVLRLQDIGGLGVDTLQVSQNFNALYTQVAEHDFELALTRLNYDNGVYDVFTDSNSIASSSSMDLTNLGSELNNNGYIQLEGDVSGATETIQPSGTPELSQVVYDPNGEYLFVAEDNGVVHIYNQGDYSKVTSINVDTQSPLKFSPDGNYFGPELTEVGTWNTVGNGTAIDPFVWSSDDNYIYKKDPDSTELWTRERKEYGLRETQTDKVGGWGNHNPGRTGFGDGHYYIADYFSDYDIYKVDKYTGDTINTYDRHTDGVYETVYHNGVMYAACRDGTLYTYDGNGNSDYTCKGYRCIATRYSTSESAIVFGDDDGYVYVGSESSRFRWGDDIIWGMDVYDGNGWVALAGNRGAEVYNLSDGSLVQVLDEGGDSAFSAEFTNDGSYLVISGQDFGLGYVYDTGTWNVVTQLSDPQNADTVDVWGADWSQTGHLLALNDEGDYNRTIVYDTSDWSVEKIIDYGDTYPSRTVKFTNDDSTETIRGNTLEYMWVALDPGEMRKYWLDRWEYTAARDMGINTSGTTRFDITSDDSEFLYANGTTVTFFDANLNQVGEVDTGDPGLLTMARYSPDDKYAAVSFSGDDGTSSNDTAGNVYIIERDNYTVEQEIKDTNTAGTFGLSWSPDNTELGISTSGDGSTYIGTADTRIFARSDWTLNSKIDSETEDQETVESVDFNADGSQVAYAVDHNTSWGSRDNDASYVHNTIGVEPEGNVTTSAKSLGFVPEKAVFGQETLDFPDEADIEYIISDENNNSLTVAQSDVDTVIDLTGTITGSSITIKTKLYADTLGESSPQLSEYAVYFSTD